jgi:hypothetical protein
MVKYLSYLMITFLLVREVTVHVQELRMRYQAQEGREGESQAQEEIT